MLTWQGEGGPRHVERKERRAVEGDRAKAAFSHFAAWEGGRVEGKFGVAITDWLTKCIRILID